MKTVIKLLKRLVTLAIVVGAGYFGWMYWQERQAAEEEEGLGEVPTQAASVRDITVSVSATGTLRPVRIVQVKSKAAGEILNMPAELGDRVESGALIAQIDTETLDQELAQAQADLESAQVRLDVSERQYNRAQALSEQDLVSMQDLDTSEQNYTTAKGSLLRAQAEIKLREERLDDATVRAPSAGTIISKTVEEGVIIQSSVNSVQGGTTLVEMADLTVLEVRTLVDEIDIGRVKPGLPVEMTVEAYPERAFIGEVIKIEPLAVVQNQVTTFPVLSRVANRDGLLLPGMNADVEVVIHRRNQVIAVPNESVKTMRDAGTVAGLLSIPFDADQLRSGNTMLASREGGAPARGGLANAAFADEARPGEGGRRRARSGDAARRGAPAAGADGAMASNDAPAADVGGSDGSDEAEAEEEDFDFDKMRSMSQDERQKYMEGLSDKQRSQMREQMQARFGNRGGGGAPGATGGAGGGAGGGFRPGGGGSDAGRGGFRPGGGDAGGGARGGRAGNAVSMDAFGIGRAPEPAVVFVMADSQITARQVMMGVQDWEFTEIVSGLQPGDEVVLLPSTSLLMSQQALRDRFSRFSSIPGTSRR